MYLESLIFIDIFSFYHLQKINLLFDFYQYTYLKKFKTKSNLSKLKKKLRDVITIRKKI